VDADVDIFAEDATAAAAQDLCPEEIGQASGALHPEAESSLAPQRYKVQFTATQEYVDLLDEARDLLAHAVPNRSLEQLHLRAMRALVAELKQRKYAVTNRPRSKAAKHADGKAEPAYEHADREYEHAGTSGADVKARRHAGTGAQAVAHESPQDGREHAVSDTSAEAAFSDSEKLNPRQRGRYIPAPVRRAVWERDGGRCTYVDSGGHRCRETSYLEMHHEQPHARGGPPTDANIHLRCRAHNALAAEEDFGREFITRKKHMTAGQPEGLFGLP
jgi:hypothetical protein